MQGKRETLIAVVFGGMLSACAHQQVAKTADAGGVAAQGAAGTEASKNEPDVRGSTLVAIPELRVIAFDYDSAALKPEARQVLKENAAWLSKHADVRVQVAGHCDERGTVEYNLALGQRRAAAVRSYYASLGVASRRIATISYGKERPLCQESNEECWARNRRAETLHAAANSASRK